MIYKLSKDYEELYRLICEGHIIVCFIDYKFSTQDEDEKPYRDVCKVEKSVQWKRIEFGVRGICYGGIYDFMLKEHTEWKWFESLCKNMKVEYIIPTK